MALFLLYILCLVVIFIYRWRFANLYHIPTIGPSLPVLSYVGAFRLVHHAKEILQEGYQKYKGGAFKIAMLDRWLVVVSGHKLVEELRRLPDDLVSFTQAAQDMVQMKYTFGEDVERDPIHIELIRSQLTRHLAVIVPDVCDEVVASFNDFIPETLEWTPVSVLPAMQKIVARVSSRILVGLPLCRDKGYLNLAIYHTMSVVKTRKLLTWFPEVLKPLVGYFINESKQGIKQGESYLGPVIQDRLEKMREYGDDWPDKPNDMIQWSIDEIMVSGRSVSKVIQTILVTNFAAIHTSSNSFTHALYHLAANPEYTKILREEADAVIKTEGWTKTGMQKLKKLDSFMRESQRINGITGISLMRKALKDLTLSNGTFIPAGATIVAAASSTHLDDEYYTNAEVFDPWRFSEMRDENGESTKHHFVSTSVDYIAFGHGRHACPGRFFAANELKTMMAHIVMNYDVKLEGGRPDNWWFSTSVTPDPTIKVLFRKRHD